MVYQSPAPLLIPKGHGIDDKISTQWLPVFMLSRPTPSLDTIFLKPKMWIQWPEKHRKTAGVFTRVKPSSTSSKPWGDQDSYRIKNAMAAWLIADESLISPKCSRKISKDLPNFWEKSPKIQPISGKNLQKSSPTVTNFWIFWDLWIFQSLVGGLEHFFFPYIGNNHPNWLSYFSEGLKPPTRSASKAALMFARGVPIIYYGTEQGLDGHQANVLECPGPWWWPWCMVS